ncbi:CAP domain-containing protein [Acetonema longum]|uniref:Allergen V5/Tpx-1 family protein n=1 Tax=Acetonema longum DSM 6540 TaxID=1009370 RepID=F7NFJ1_9FIRM|nr:CAP domain-containing protein [Acetonema longum]EGO65190.1 Allergen V5/Tpx-1 family protein [Acetonema longum DSM 6540]
MRKALAYILVIAVIIGFWPSMEGVSAKSRKTAAGEPTYSQDLMPIPGSSVTDPRPILKWEVYPNGNAVTAFHMLLDGKLVKASRIQDDHTVTWSYQPDRDLAPGRHTLVCQVTFKGYQPLQVSSTFTVVDPSSLSDPFRGKDRQSLATLEWQAVAAINGYRDALGLPRLLQHERLSRSAQAHSNYLQINASNGHQENRNYPGFTGVSSQDRAAYYGYTGTVSEGLSYGYAWPWLHIATLMDAPYHRLSLIDPNDRDVGIGLNLPHNLVVVAGSQHQRTNDAVMVYPYSGQPDAKISWFAAESPNPLASYRLDRVYVGYPISVSLHDSNTRELRFIAGSIKDNLGRDVPYYLVDSMKESQYRKHVFLIPKQILTPGLIYTVSVQAERVTIDGKTAPVRREWSFATQRQPGLDYTGIERFEGIENLVIRYDCGDLPDLEYVLYRNGEIVRRYQTATGYSWSSRAVLENGLYKLQVSSSYLPSFLEYELNVTGAGEARQVMVKSERAMGQTPAVRAGLIRLGGREHIELLFSDKKPTGLKYTLTKDGQVRRTYDAAQSGYYAYGSFELTNGEYLLEISNGAASWPQRFSLVIAGEKETRTVKLTALPW